MHFKGIIFDLDDTLVEFGALGHAVWEEVCDRYSQLHAGLDYQTLLDTVNRTANWYWSDPDRHKKGRNNMKQARRDVMELTFRTLGLDNLALAHEIADEYTRERHDRVELFEDVPGVLSILKKKYILILLTNGEQGTQRYKINKFQLDRTFEHIFVEGEVGYGKPEPEAYENVLKTTGLTAGELCMVGDNLIWDVEGAQKMGIYSIWNDHKKQGLPPGSTIKPDLIITHVRELLDVL